MIYLTSDLHLCHNKNFLFQPRGFSSIEEHDKAIIDNINKIVKQQDTLYILGDLLLGDNMEGEKKLHQIQCEDVRIIRGNHCTDVRVHLYEHSLGYQVLGCATLIKYKKKNFMLSHYPMLTQNMDDGKKPWQKTWNLCGHSHTKNKFDPITHSIHVELDAWDNKPVEIEEILELIRNEGVRGI